MAVRILAKDGWICDGCEQSFPPETFSTRDTVFAVCDPCVESDAIGKWLESILTPAGLYPLQPVIGRNNK